MQHRLGLSGNKRFSQIHQQGQSAADRLLVIRVLPNGLQHSRFAFVVSKRIGGATVRNKVKRRLREAVRQAPVKRGWDVVFIARRGVEQASYWHIKGVTDKLLRRMHLVGGASLPAPIQATEVSPQ
jgi:ribonuclease P protein component